ncbi:IS30 family transposase [Streptomyces sp. NPDC005426]|uniref:IS30 family transposase n=1 Tax=Streptomyces sp. NPDC005426 TaxID=3155344 RepID=UPI0033BC2E2E
MSGSEREEISRGLAAGESAWQLAKRLNRSPSTVSREIARNGGRDRYRAASADAAAYERGRRPKQAKLAQRPAPRALVEAKLALCWSPEQIAGWLRRQFPGDASMQISHEAIYLSLYDPRRSQAIDRGPTQRLRSGRPMRRPKLARRPTGRGIIRGMVSITDRPTGVEDRKVPGHWEGDLVMGTRPSAVATLVERTSRYTAIVALPDGIKAEQVTPHLTRSLLGIPPQLRRTLAWTGVGRWPSTKPSPPGCRSTSASPGARGSAAPTRTPTGCYGSTWPRGRTSARPARLAS